MKEQACFWNKRVLQDIMIACIIMHNMVIKDEHNLSAPIKEFNPAPILNFKLMSNEVHNLISFLLNIGKLKIR